MRSKIDMKSVAFGVGLGALLLILAGAANSRNGIGEIGRFQIACTSTLCYLVDTVNGEVWSTGDKGFWESKLGVATDVPSQVLPVQPTAPAQDVQPRQPAAEQGFVGRWVADNADSATVSLQINADGTAMTTDEVSHYAGRWNALGSQVVITVDSDILMGTLMNDGRLLVSQPGNDEYRAIFHRAPQ